jgi:hypothetical protein
VLQQNANLVNPLRPGLLMQRNAGSWRRVAYGLEI